MLECIIFCPYVLYFVHGSGSGGSSELILGHIKYCKYTQYNDCVALNRLVDEYAYRAIFYDAFVYLDLC